MLNGDYTGGVGQLPSPEGRNQGVALGVCRRTTCPDSLQPPAEDLLH